MTVSSLSRRELLKLSGAAALGLVCPLRPESGSGRAVARYGCVVGEKTGEKAGMRVLADGGNAIDAVVAAALTAAVAAPSSAGIGGYGMSAVVAVDGGRRIAAVDGNSAAPAAMRADIFQPGPDGKVPDGFDTARSLSSTGWLSAGVPGVLAGLQLILDTFGSRRIGELLQPAIALARDGFPWPEGLAAAINRRREIFLKDPGSRKLFFPRGKPLSAGEPFRNPDLAEMLAALARAGSAEAFYRGDIGRHIADAFRKNGGLVTMEDMAAYRARLAEPLTLNWGGHAIHTAPLTAGGLTVLQILRAMQAMDWEKMPAGLPRLHARIEATRLAWRDRVMLLGDPDFGEVPVTRLLSESYARESAEKIAAAVKAGKMLPGIAAPRPQTGTVHLSAADGHGDFAALTLTHGEGFGACVTVEGLGLTLGHGMSRFDPNPGHPNAPGPRKRPLHNMTPTIVTREGKPVLAAGGTGGRKIPNALLEVLTQFAVLGRPLEASIASPRLHTEGDASVIVEDAWPAGEIEGMRRLGYAVTAGGSANISAVAIEKDGLREARR